MAIRQTMLKGVNPTILRMRGICDGLYGQFYLAAGRVTSSQAGEGGRMHGGSNLRQYHMEINSPLILRKLYNDFL